MVVADLLVIISGTLLYIRMGGGDGDDRSAVIKASAIVHQIANTQSRYRPQAEELFRTLGQ
jgi:hypothetical protein